jgi:hypothetical protein
MACCTNVRCLPGSTPDSTMARQNNCWHEGCATDLLSYCDNIKCDALLLFINGVRSNRTRPAAYFKTSNGSRLSVASKFRLSPQAVLYVKKNSSWTGNASQDVVKVRKCAERTQSFCALCTLVKHPRPAVHRSQRPCCTGMQHCGQWRFAAARDMRLGYFGRFAHW